MLAKLKLWWQKITADPKSEIILLIAIFLLAAGIYFAIANYTKVFGIYHDDLRHYDLARNIFNGNGLVIHNAEWYYQKILYPVLISPFFAISDVTLRISMIALFNSILLASSIFPIWLITKHFKLAPHMRFIIITIFLFTPALVFNETCMNESLYSALVFWFLWLWLINNQKQNYLFSALLGLLSYLIYLTKEAGIIFIACYVIYELIYPLIKRLIVSKEKRELIRNYYHKERFINASIHLLTFIVCFVTIKLSLFRGWPNSYLTGETYDLLSIGVLFKGANFGWFIYGTIYMFISLFAAMFIVPLLYPIICCKQIDEEHKQTTIYLLLLFIVSSVIFSYTLTIREDLGDLVPRLHQRYLFPLLYLSLIVFVSLDFKNISRYRKPLFISLTAMSVVILLMFRGSSFKGLSFEAPNLAWYQFLINKLPSAPIYGQFTLSAGAIIANLIIIGIAFLLYLTINQKIKIKLSPKIAFSGVLVVFSVLSSVYSDLELKRFNNHVDITLINEVNKLNEYFKDKPDTNILYLSFGSDTPKNNYNHYGVVLDDYFDHTKNLSYITSWGLYNLFEEYQPPIIPIKNITFYEWYSGFKNPQVEKIDYLIVNTDILYLDYKITNIEPILIQDNYCLYQNLDPINLCYQSLKAKRTCNVVGSRLR